MRCPNCGAINEDGANFCGTCGINLQGNPNFSENKTNQVYTTTVEGRESQQQNNGGSDGWCCCICLIAIFIIFAVISAF